MIDFKKSFMILKKRPKFCSVSYFNTNGDRKHEDFEIMKSRIFLHENDHLEGHDLKEDKQNIVDKKSIQELMDEDKMIKWYEAEHSRGYFL